MPTDVWMRCSRPLLASALLAAVVGSGCSTADGDETQATAAPAETTGVRVINVEVTPVELSGFADFIRITGEVEAMHDVTVSAEEMGAIERFFVEKGSAVRRGQPVAKIDDAVLAAQVAEARAMAQLAAEEFERQRRLWEDENIGSEIAYLRTRSASQAAAARLTTLEARLARTVIRAPVDGIFDEKFAEQGEMASPGTPIARFVAIRTVKIIGGVPERFALSVHRGDSARVWLDVLPDQEFVGTIAFVGASVDSRNRTVPIEILLDNRDGVAKPRMVANVQVERERLQDVVVVPQEVVIRTEDGYEVFVAVERDGSLVAEPRSVTLGPSYANQVVIERGLEVGDPLITLGHRLVENGSHVRIVNAAGVDR